MLIEAAQSIARGKPNRLKHFFSRIQSWKRYKKAIVALARKVLSIVHHFLSNHEKYVESPGKEKKTKLPNICPDPGMDHKEMIDTLSLKRDISSINLIPLRNPLIQIVELLLANTIHNRGMFFIPAKKSLIKKKEC